MKVALEPVLVADGLGGVATADLGVEEVGVLGGRVVAPDRHLADLGDGHAELLRELADGTVVVETGQGRETLGGDVGSVGHRDEGVGVGRVAGDRDPHVVGRDVVERLALGGEDAAVGLEQVAALHAGAAGAGPDEQGVVDAVEDGPRVVTDLDLGESREGAVVELHDDALEGLEGGRDLEEPELDGGVGTEQCAARDAEQEAVADLACGAGDGDLHRGGDGGSAHGVDPSHRCGCGRSDAISAGGGPRTALGGLSAALGGLGGGAGVRRRARARRGRAAS